MKILLWWLVCYEFLLVDSDAPTYKILLINQYFNDQYW